MFIISRSLIVIPLENCIKGLSHVKSGIVRVSWIKIYFF